MMGVTIQINDGGQIGSDAQVYFLTAGDRDEQGESRFYAAQTNGPIRPDLTFVQIGKE